MIYPLLFLPLILALPVNILVRRAPMPVQVPDLRPAPWFQDAWERSLAARAARGFVGDRPFFPPCKASAKPARTFPMIVSQGSMGGEPGRQPFFPPCKASAKPAENFPMIVSQGSIGGEPVSRDEPIPVTKRYLDPLRMRSYRKWHRKSNLLPLLVNFRRAETIL